MNSSRGSRNSILIVGDSLPSNLKTQYNITQVLDPIHPVYNSIIIPIKFYINNYLLQKNYQLPIEKKGMDFFFYINAISDAEEKNNSDLTELIKEINPLYCPYKLILSMGSFAFYSVEKVFERNVKKKLSINELGEYFFNRINLKNKIKFPINIPILHNIVNLKFEKATNFIYQNSDKYISYHHYVGEKIAEFIVNSINDFNFIKEKK